MCSSHEEHSLQASPKYQDTPSTDSNQTLLVGMPQLSYGGLSENWLLKECGHRHWLALASLFGQPTPDFQDRHGHKLYAAFVACRVVDAQLGTIHENEKISLATSLDQISRSQHLSRHVIRHNDKAVAHVEMVSAFLRRTIPGRNSRIQRGYVVGEQSNLVTVGLSISDLPSTAHQLRLGKWEEYLGFSHAISDDLKRFSYLPCPHTDFNGAAFLYFASFQSIIDRAEWEWNHQPDAIAHTQRRDLFFYSNLDLGEKVTVILRGGQTSTNVERTFRHWCQIIAESDGRLMADVFTTKRLETEPSMERTLSI
ncbi:Pnap_2097 family protein [Bradyrhizobium sp. SZCCHNRI1009]|uniref:Pnap_2097 family protein n=1 Tax=Bradyrhizobium sp. SZCCHNRI1009 TaxID=3057277 RepID=UPI002917120F|nr:Pnap_2097 family protein [Bradyrhizobium sp. SZCCHNRI1009]